MHIKAKTFTSVLHTTAIVCTCQSILWMCLSICAILTFRCVLPTPQYGDSSFILTTIVKLWFQGDECIVKDDIPGYPELHKVKHMKPADVFSWMVGYLTVSIVSLIISILLFKYKAKEQLKFVLSTWCFTSLFTAIMDVILTFLFILDYCEIKEHVKNCEDEQNISRIPAAMFIISGRGFVLWLINFALVVYFILWLKKPPQEKLQEKTNTKRRESHIHGYDNFTFQNATDYTVDGQMKSMGMERGFAREREMFQRRPSKSSFEAVTPFNEERFPEPPRKSETAQMDQRYLRPNAFCFCTDKQKNYSHGKYYHSHACPSLMSEIEEKFQTMRRKRDQACGKDKTLVDFSHDIRNFERGNQTRSNTERLSARGRDLRQI